MFEPAFFAFIYVHRLPEQKDDWKANYRSVEKNRKVFRGGADEGSGQRGSFPQGGPGQAKQQHSRLPGQAPEAGNQHQRGPQGESQCLWVS